MQSTKQLREQEQTQLKANRANQILEIGYTLFLEKGLAKVEMKDIAAASQIGRATLYRYFSTKQTLAFAIMQQVASKKIIPKYRSERKTFEGNGHEKFAQFIDQLVNAYKMFPNFFRYSAMVESYYGQQLPAQQQADWYRELFAGLFLEDTPQQFLEEGQRDGSVRQDIDPHTYLAMTLATLPTLAEHIAINQEAARLTYNVSSPDILLQTAASALIQALKP